MRRAVAPFPWTRRKWNELWPWCVGLSAETPSQPASRVLAWSVSLGLNISTPHMCLCGVWEHYRLQSAMASDRWPTIAPPHPPIPRAWHYAPFPSPFPSCSSHPAVIIQRRGPVCSCEETSQTPIGVTASAQESRACSDVINESCQSNTWCEQLRCLPCV